MKQHFKWFALLVTTWIVIEGASFAGLVVLKKVHGIEFEPIDVISKKHKRILTNVINGDPTYKIPSPTLGWTIKSHGQARSYETGSLGIRGQREYSLAPPDRKVRIAAFGDSFTWGSGVGHADTWPAILEEREPGFEIMNFGVGGYGLDQAYLRYLQDGKIYRPHIVLIGFMTENIFRHVNTFRPFYVREAGAPYAKPRFVLADDRLKLVPNPIAKTRDYASIVSESRSSLAALGAYDFYYANHYKSGPWDFSAALRLAKIGIYQLRRRFIQPIEKDGFYNTRSEAYQVTIALFRQFYCDAVMNGSLPIILVFPDGADVVRGLRKGEKRYLPLLKVFDEKGYRYIDGLSAFEKPHEDVDWKQLVRGHYTARGNAQVARRLDEYLLEHDLNTVSTVKATQLMEWDNRRMCKREYTLDKRIPAETGWR